MRLLCRIALCAFFVVLFTGCGEDSAEVHTYKVVYPDGTAPPGLEADDDPHAGHDHGEHDGHDHGEHDGHDHGEAAPSAKLPYAWTTPESWKAMPGGGMRMASFKLPGDTAAELDCSIIRLGPVAGSAADNINRWRGQIGLERLAEADVLAATETFKTDGGLPAVRCQLNSHGDGTPTADDKSIRAAIIQDADATVFIKMIGRHDGVTANAAAFDALVASFRRN